MSQTSFVRADAHDEFGYSISISGNTLVVGARGEASNSEDVNGAQNNNFAPNSGAVYVFVRNGSTWSQQAYLKASNAAFSDQFGEALSLSGDSLVVGAFAEDSGAGGVDGNQSDNSAERAGAAHAFDLGAWSDLGEAHSPARTVTPSSSEVETSIPTPSRPSLLRRAWRSRRPSS